MKQKALALGLVLCLFALSAAGCAATPPSATPAPASAPDASPASSATQAPAGDEAPQSVTLTAMIVEQPGAPLTTDALVFAQVAKATGVSFEFSNVPGADFAQKAHTTLASNSLPDIMEGTNFNPTEYIYAGAFLRLDELLASDGQNILSAYEEFGVEKNAKFADGGYYEIYTLLERKFYLNNTINNDWLKETNQAMPTNMDELFNVLIAFRDAKSAEGGIPFGCGPWTGGGAALTNMVKKSFGATSGIMLYEDGFFFAPYERQDRYKAAMAWLAKAYAENLLDPQMFSTTDDELVKLRNTGKIGFYSGWGDGYSTPQSYGIDLIPAPVMDTEFGPGGEIITEPRSAYVMLTKTCKDPAAAIRAFNYLYSEEGQLLTNWGIKDETYTEDAAGNKTFTDLIMNAEEGSSVARYSRGLGAPHFPNIVRQEMEVLLNGPTVLEVAEYVKDKAFPLQPRLSATQEESRELTQIMADIDKYIGECETKFVVGQMSVEEDFDKFIAQLEKMNIARAIEIYQAQYQRYLAN